MSDKEVAPQVLEHPGTRPTETEETVDEVKIPSAGDLFTSAPQGDRRPEETERCLCCYNG
jgi:hypothetical protein